MKSFHNIANEGKAITGLRLYFESQGVYLSAFRVEILIKLQQLKARYYS